jgi:SulP family sulfate permease
MNVLNMVKKSAPLANARGDILGGVTAGIVALPLALGFGVASGVENGAAAGLYGAIIVGFLAAVFGGTPSQISGPTGPMTVVVAALAATLVATAEQPIPLEWVFMMVALSGLFQVVLGLLRLGRYINYMPYPVISGFMSGIGVIIVILQLAQFVGHSPEKSVLSAVSNIPHHFSNVNVQALLLGLATVAIIYSVPRVTKAIPGPLVALILVTAASVLFGMDTPRIGSIPSGLPGLQIPQWDFNALQLIVVPAFVLAVVGSIDSLLTSLVADTMTKTKHDSERELMGQGIGNFFAGLLGGLPGAGATMRTVINIRSGGMTKLSGVVHAVLLALTLLVLGPLAARIPLAVLAGILVTVGIGIVDVKGLKHVLRVPRGDAAVMLTTLLLTVFVDLMWAVAVGMVLASLILMKRLADLDPATHSPLKDIAAHRPWIPDLDDHSDQVLGDVHVVEIHGSLFFGNAGPLQRKLGGLNHAKTVVLHLGAVPFLDQSGAYALADVIEELKGTGIDVFVCSLQAEPAKVLADLGVAPGLVDQAHIIDSAEQAVRSAVELRGPRQVAANA